MTEKTFDEVLKEECEDDAYEHAMDDRAEEKRKTKQEAELENLLTEQMIVSKAMCIYGGGFVSHLGQALQRADPINAKIIKDGFADYWQQYLATGEMMKKKE